MRVIQVVNVRWYNATAWYGVTLAEALQKAGHTSLVVGVEHSAPLAEARAKGLDTAALPLNSLNPFVLAELWRSMNTLVRDFQPDVVNCHRGEAFVLWALLKRRYPFALVRTRGDQRLPKSSRINRWLYNSAADALIVTNSAMARHCAAKLQTPHEHMRTILGGVDTQRFFLSPEARATVRARLGFQESDIVVGLVGRMDVVKGVKECVEALGLAVKEGGPEAARLRFLIIGFDSQYSTDDVARWTAEAGLGDLGGRVCVTGKVERPEDYINALDVGVLASLGSEAIARAALEIMACGVPLVSSRVGVMPDLLPEDLLFAPGDVKAMAAAMLRFLDAARRSHVGNESLVRMTAGLSLEDFREKSLEVYRAVCGAC